MPHDSLLDLLTQGEADKLLRPLDSAFGRFLAEEDRHAHPALPLLGAILSRQQADGHLCLDLASWTALADESAWPRTWRDTLAEAFNTPTWRTGSPLLDEAHTPHHPASPLVLDGVRLYLRRYWNHEQRIAQAIALRLSRPALAPAELGGQLARLFPTHAQGMLDWQRVACALAARGAFTVITGGPGTGKTTTVVRLLGLLQTLHRRDTSRPLRIRLAAPTGKAAARLQASISTQIALLDVEEPVRASIPHQVDTLHRLLGARPDTRRFRHDASHPLHLDVLVIDEASMIDLEMMSAVLAALPDEARLVLLGDKDQLSSVEAGAVLGDLCRRAEAGHYDTGTAQWVADVSGDRLDAWVSADAQPLDQQVAMLRHSHRFGVDSGIGRLAQHVNSGDIDHVRALFAQPHSDIAWLRSAANHAALNALVLDGASAPFDAAASDAQPRGFRFYLEHLKSTRPAALADATAYATWARGVLHAFGSFQLLCALRKGLHGTEQLNQQITEILQKATLIDAGKDWYEGRPVLVTRNDYHLGLMNGDVGIVLRVPDDQGRLQLRVAFEVAGQAQGDATRVRFVQPARLGDLETVYAMTVHKSQGSEFEHAALVLPDEFSPVMTRELLYTGITRARRHFSLLATDGSVAWSLGNRSRRQSGLSAALAHYLAATASD